MTTEIIRDEGQTLSVPKGKVLGIVETRVVCENVAQSLNRAGFPKVEVLTGDEGINLLQRVNQFFFSDMEDRVLKRHLEELEAGHAVIAIEAASDRVNEAMRLATDLGARSIVHFGLLTVTVLTK